MDRDHLDPLTGAVLHEGRCVRRHSGRLRQAVGLSLKIWSARAPICRDRLAALSNPRSMPRWRPTSGASAARRVAAAARGASVLRWGSWSSRPRTRARPPSVEALEQPTTEPEDELDLASIGLAAFFVSLILVVGALLIVPAIF